MAEETVTMHGPAFTAKGEIVERQVPKSDVVAFEKDGYVKGPLPAGGGESRPRADMASKKEEVESAEAKPLDEMTKAELLEEADKRGVEVSGSATKAEILAALEG